MNQQLGTLIVQSFTILTDGIPDEKAIILDALESTLTIINEDTSISEIRQIELPDMKIITKSQQQKMMGKVIKLPGAEFITWETEGGKYTINIKNYDFKKIGK